jgi:uncharacterized lipoprotein YajG
MKKTLLFLCLAFLWGCNTPNKIENIDLRDYFISPDNIENVSVFVHTISDKQGFTDSIYQLIAKIDDNQIEITEFNGAMETTGIIRNSYTPKGVFITSNTIIDQDIVSHSKILKGYIFPYENYQDSLIVENETYLIGENLLLKDKIEWKLEELTEDNILIGRGHFTRIISNFDESPDTIHFQTETHYKKGFGIIKNKFYNNEF